MNRWGQIAVRWLKFNTVGGIGIVIQLTILLVLTRGLRLDYLLATVLAVETTIIHNFLWHQRFTWPERRGVGLPGNILRWLKFNVSAGTFSIAGNLALMRVLVGVAHLNFLVANLATIAACSIMNFLISDLLVFRRAVR